MPFYYCVDDREKCLLVWGTGDIADDDFLDTVDRVVSLPGISRDYLRAWDFRSVDRLVLTPKVLTDFRSIVDTRRHLMGDRLAVIGTSDILLTMAKLLTSVSNQQHRLVRSPREAEDWLGLARGTLDRIARAHPWTKV